MSEKKDPTVPIVSYIPEKRLAAQSRPKEDTKLELIAVTTDVPLKVFEDGIADVSDSLDASFKQLTSRDYSGLQLDEVEVKLEVSAEGKVGILGNGASAKGAASIKLKFKRK